MIYPATDHHAEAAIARAAAGHPAEPLRLEIPRPWARPPEALCLEVTLQPRPGAGANALEALIGEACFPMDDPVALLPVEIPKPWGRELWFTGVEARGEAQVAGSGGTLALGTWLSLAPARSVGRQPLVLLKILDPRPEPVLGELYLEVHEAKREVYVVTAIDPVAWPDGRGRIRFGVNQTARAAEGSDDAFRRSFMDALAAYERAQAAVESRAEQPADFDTAKAAEHASREALAAEERIAREATLKFTDERTLSVGDVISVPTWVPHSLQQGVQVVEFQTPNYERHILSSSQKVLTQTHWDSERAVQGMHLDPPATVQPEILSDGVERIVAFEDFGVWRVQSRKSLTPPSGLPYTVVFCIEGSLHLQGPGGSLELGSGEAALLPCASAGYPIGSVDDACYLLAAPGL
ncbi:MAG: hypothetical protein AAGE43_01070 [Pseudomonadota bacterium]